VLTQSEVIFCTVDQLPNKKMKDFRGDVHSIYIDEASLVPEEVMPIIALYDPTSLIMIGDQMQLRPFTNLPSSSLNLCNQDDKLYCRSFFERCIDKGLPYVQLQENYRNPPELVKILNTMTYTETPLIAMKAVGSSSVCAIRWMDHSHREVALARDQGQTSSRNPGEVNEIAKLYRRLRSEGKRGIMIITFYLQQRNDLQDRIDLAAGDQIVTVDSCQGSEANTVIVSCVRGNAEGRVGFTIHPNRLNVAISRPKELLVIVGNRATFEHEQRDGRPTNALWCKLIREIDQIPKASAGLFTGGGAAY